MRKIMASLDIGTGSVKLVVGEINKKRLNILAVGEVPSKGIKKGEVLNPELLTEAIKNAIKKGEEALGFKIKQVIVTVPAQYAEFAVVESNLTITNENHKIRGLDIIKVMQLAVKGKLADNMEAIALMPTVFRLDDEKLVKDPKNMVAKTLAVKAVLVTAPKKIIYPFLECVEKNNLEVIDLSFASIGDYYELRKPENEDQVGAVINLGETTSTVAIFNKNVLTNIEVIDLGGQSIDNDISFIYKLTRNDAKSLKESLALAHKHSAQASLSEEVTNKLGETSKINQYELTEIVMSRLTEILNLVKKQINHLTKKEISYIIFTGGLTEGVDFSLVLEEIFGHNVIVGHIEEIGARHNKYSAALGLIKYYDNKSCLKDKEFSILSPAEQEELGENGKRLNINENSILGKLFGYFFDN